MAFAVMDVLRFELGLRIPEDVSVAGFDDVPPAAWPAYALTSFRQRINRMVAETVTTLMDRIEGGEHRAPAHPHRRQPDRAGLHRADRRDGPVKGFDPKWRDVPHFIIGITKEIWEDREIASLTPPLRARTSSCARPPRSSSATSRVIAATMATLAEFPDRELLGEDVIWCDDPARATGGTDAFLSSHRLLSPPPTPAPASTAPRPASASPTASSPTARSATTRSTTSG